MSSTSTLPLPGSKPSPPEHDLFIIHANADRAWVEGYLKPGLGLEPGRAITQREFDPTATVPAEFERAVTSSRFTLLVLSQAFRADEWARFGEQLVSFASVEAGQVRLLAVDLKECDLPLSLRFRVRLDFKDPDGWDDEIARLRAVLNRPAPVIEAVVCPYPGMVPFRQQDARFFHGRDDEIQTLLTLVRQHHFLLVIGPSGSGKSSLVTAGLLPKLDDPRHFPPGTWRVLTIRPGATPVDELARSFGVSLDEPGPAITALLAALPPAQRMLLVVDQFEELFSQVQDASTREAFIGRLKALRSDPRCTVIVAMRADFYGDLMNSPLWPVDRSQIVEIGLLQGESLRKAIIKPAEAMGVYLEDGLVERLLADAASEPGVLPMLQEALVLLWGTMSGRLLTRASYDSLGRDGRSGLAVAMATKADATLADLPPEEQRIARRIFLRLVQFGEGRPDTRRQAGVDDLRAASDASGAFDKVLQLLIANRLLTPSADKSRGPRVDIAHEMLIVGWPAFREWVQARRDFEQTRRLLAAKAKEWVRFGRGESGLLDPAALAEAERWLASPDALDLGIDADVQALAVASREAIDREAREKEDVRRRELKAAQDLANERELVIKAQRKAMENAAEILIGAGSTALLDGHFFDAMHRFAGAIETMPGSSLDQVTMRQALGLLARGVPRLEAIVEEEQAVRSAAFSGDGTRVVTALDDNTARVWRADTGDLVAEHKGHADSVGSAAFSPDGALVVTASYDGTARVWRADTGALVTELKAHAGIIRCAAFSTDGMRVVTASDDHTARVWRADTGAFAELKGHTDSVYSAAFSRDGARVVTASKDKTARIWRADTSDSVAELKGHTSPVDSAAFSPDGARVVTASQDQTARVWRAETVDLVAELKGHAGLVNSAAFSPDGARVVTASFDQTARVWLPDTGALVAELKGHEGSVNSATFSPDGARVLTVSGDGTARVWLAGTGALLAELKGHEGWVLCAAFSPDGARAVTGSSEQTVRVWRAGTCALVAVLKGHEGPVVSAAFSPDGVRVVTTSDDQTARVWQADTGDLLAELQGRADIVKSAAFSPDGARVVTASKDKTARVWRADTGDLVAELTGHMYAVYSAAFSADGARVVTAGWDHTARVWLAGTGALVAELNGHEGLLFSAAFSPDSVLVVTVSADSTARVWRADTGAAVAVLKGHKHMVNSAVFSPDGARVVTASWDKTARVWLAGTGALVAELKGHKDPVNSAAFSPDSARVVTASDDRTARVWRADTGALVAELKGHAGRVRCAAFSPDGARVVTASWDNTARVWRADSGSLVAVLKGHAGPVVSAAFSPDGARVVTASHDKTAWIWRFDAVPGDASLMPKWVEVLTGTELKGGVVRPLSLAEWNERRQELQAKGDQAPPADWFTPPAIKSTIR